MHLSRDKYHRFEKKKICLRRNGARNLWETSLLMYQNVYSA